MYIDGLGWACFGRRRLGMLLVGQVRRRRSYSLHIALRLPIYHWVLVWCRGFVWIIVLFAQDNRVVGRGTYREILRLGQ